MPLLSGHHEDLTRALHTFTTRWRAEGIDFLIDGRVVHQTRGASARREVPWEPQSLRVILRPTNRVRASPCPAARVLPRRGSRQRPDACAY